MSIITKQWSNGDALTLETSASGIAVSSSQNMTGADRQIIVRVQTNNTGIKAYQDVLIKQLKQPDTRGWWTHKDTGVKTYFDSSAGFINDAGVMSEPSWITDAKKIRLCAGITDFEKRQCSSNYKPASHSICDILSNAKQLSKFDFGSAQVSRVYSYMFQQSYDLIEVVLNSHVTTIEPAFNFKNLTARQRTSLLRVTIPSSVSSIENGSMFGQITVEVFGNNPNLTTIYTDVGNSNNLSSLLNGKGLPEGYQIIEV